MFKMNLTLTLYLLLQSFVNLLNIIEYHVSGPVVSTENQAA